MDHYNQNKNSSENKLSRLYFTLYEAMINKDIESLNKLLTSDFTLTHMTGLIQPKSEFIKAIADQTLNYYEADHKEIELIKIENEIELIGKSKVKARVFGGSVNIWRLKLKIKIQEQKGEYAIKEIVASTY